MHSHKLWCRAVNVIRQSREMNDHLQENSPACFPRHSKTAMLTKTGCVWICYGFFNIFRNATYLRALAWSLAWSGLIKASVWWGETTTTVVISSGALLILKQVDIMLGLAQFMCSEAFTAWKLVPLVTVWTKMQTTILLSSFVAFINSGQLQFSKI